MHDLNDELCRHRGIEVKVECCNLGAECESVVHVITWAGDAGPVIGGGRLRVSKMGEWWDRGSCVQWYFAC